MRLVDWRKRKGWTQKRLATELGVSQSYVSQMERARGPIVPTSAVMIEIFEITGGAVQPNDFFDLPDLATARAAA